MTTSAQKIWQRSLGGNGWTIVEADSFSAGAAACGGFRAVEDIIAPIKLGLSRNPKQFPLTARPNIGIAKTITHWRGAEIVMGYTVWFRVIEQAQTVELLFIEVTNPDNVEWSYDPSDG